jgi:hypothetical protein
LNVFSWMRQEVIEDAEDYVFQGTSGLCQIFTAESARVLV